MSDGQYVDCVQMLGLYEISIGSELCCAGYSGVSLNVFVNLMWCIRYVSLSSWLPTNDDVPVPLAC